MAKYPKETDVEELVRNIQTNTRLRDDEDLYYNPDAVPFVFRYSKRATTLSEPSV